MELRHEPQSRDVSEALSRARCAARRAGASSGDSAAARSRCRRACCQRLVCCPCCGPAHSSGSRRRGPWRCCHACCHACCRCASSRVGRLCRCCARRAGCAFPCGAVQLGRRRHAPPPPTAADSATDNRRLLCSMSDRAANICPADAAWCIAIRCVLSQVQAACPARSTLLSFKPQRSSGLPVALVYTCTLVPCALAPGWGAGWGPRNSKKVMRKGLHIKRTQELRFSRILSTASSGLSSV